MSNIFRFLNYLNNVPSIINQHLKKRKKKERFNLPTLITSGRAKVPPQNTIKTKIFSRNSVGYSQCIFSITISTTIKDATRSKDTPLTSCAVFLWAFFTHHLESCWHFPHWSTQCEVQYSDVAHKLAYLTRRTSDRRVIHSPLPRAHTLSQSQTDNPLVSLMWTIH